MTTHSAISEESYLYPWQKGLFHELIQHQIPHSLLLFGQKDIGKLKFGLELANYLLCESSDQKPCGVCDACHWVKQGSHPDLFIVLPQNLRHLLPFEIENDADLEDADEKKQSKVIRIEQIRHVISSNELGSYRGGKRVVLIYPIESMQIEAANCLLKTLEEPSSNLHFVLITHQLERILPTIRSRCLLFSIPKPPINEAISWLSTQLPDKWTAPLLAQRLSLHSGAPLKVMASINDKALDESIITNQLAKFKSLHTGEIIDLLSQYSILEILNCILKWSFDLNLVLFGQQVRYFPQFEEKMKSSCLAMNKIHFQQFLSGLKDDLRLANHPLFPKVQLEAVLMKYTQLFK